MGGHHVETIGDCTRFGYGLVATCQNLGCGHQAPLNLTRLIVKEAANLTLRRLEKRLTCKRCTMRRARVDLVEKRARMTLGQIAELRRAGIAHGAPAAPAKPTGE